jgi:hypothetical protein
MVCTCASASLKRDGLVRIGAAATPPGKPLRTAHSRRRPHAPPTVSRAAISVAAISTPQTWIWSPLAAHGVEGWVVGNEPYVSLHFLGKGHYAK